VQRRTAFWQDGVAKADSACTAVGRARARRAPGTGIGPEPAVIDMRPTNCLHCDGRHRVAGRGDTAGVPKSASPLLDTRGLPT